ncbi:MAG: HAD hydrolase-like protein [Gammaproteobacteria bacterium]|nr:HAD hydrolase-like protein [Gammaproteobacteria bacterium]MCP5135297.1 HAD hydrolase-like protein [Gammaproteobacteria bacterium]
MPEPLNAYQLPERHAGILLDAYGVLVNRAGVLPGAGEYIQHLNDRHIPYAILTNAASRGSGELADFFQGLGLAIPGERIISSGALVAEHFRKHGLAGARTHVIGTVASQQFAIDGGAMIVTAAEAEVFLITDQCGFPFLETLDAALNRIIQRHECAEPTHLICCNPDLIYPTTDSEFGFTAGSIAGLLERALDERYGNAAPKFAYLGKPYAPIFAAGRMRCGTDNLVMIGDTPSTDILGANRFGIASALIGARDWTPDDKSAIPDYLLRDLLKR